MGERYRPARWRLLALVPAIIASALIALGLTSLRPWFGTVVLAALLVAFLLLWRGRVGGRAVAGMAISAISLVGILTAIPGESPSIFDFHFPSAYLQVALAGAYWIIACALLPRPLPRPDPP